MPNILAIETSTTVCSVALWTNNLLFALKENHEKNAHSRMLSVMIKEIFSENKFSINFIDAVAVSKGPGSYTGLRIGVSLAKGLCYGLSKPLIAVDTLKALAQQYLLLHPETKNCKEIPLCPMLDARRLEVYTALYNSNLDEILSVSSLVIEDSCFQKYLHQKKIIFFGPGAKKCKNIISSPNAIFVDDIDPSAHGVGVLSQELYKNKQFADIAYFEPFYLKDFIAIKSNKKFF